jgi:Ca2+-binding RTX toxin-like protein
VVREAGDDPFRWLVFDLDRVIVGGGDQDVVAGDDLILGRREQPVLMGEEDRDVPLGGAGGAGFRGDDILAAGAGASALFGGRGDGAFRSGIGDTFAAGGSGAAVLRSADLLDFDDRAFAGAGDGLGPVAPGATAQLASVSLDDLVTAPDVD